jgi:hypothetical protein
MVNDNDSMQIDHDLEGNGCNGNDQSNVSNVNTGYPANGEANQHDSNGTNSPNRNHQQTNGIDGNELTSNSLQVGQIGDNDDQARTNVVATGMTNEEEGTPTDSPAPLPDPCAVCGITGQKLKWIHYQHHRGTPLPYENPATVEYHYLCDSHQCT